MFSFLNVFIWKTGKPDLTPEAARILAVCNALAYLEFSFKVIGVFSTFTSACK